MQNDSQRIDVPRLREISLYRIIRIIFVEGRLGCINFEKVSDPEDHFFIRCHKNVREAKISICKVLSVEFLNP
jgi:hypothetical protein